MAEGVIYAEVWVWGRFVGAVAETDTGEVVFEYDPAFHRHGLELSPIMLPVSRQGPITFAELRSQPAFEGLPGVLADALPDRFGNAVIAKYFADRGRPDDALRPVQKLLYIGTRAMGALEFRPPHAVRRAAEQEPLDLADLVAQARVVVEGRPDVSIPEMMRIGASAGGARAKALVLWNRDANHLRSGFADPRDGDEHWIIKFDGVGEVGEPDATPKPFNRIEYAYSRMARNAGITMPDTHLLEERGNGHFLVRRFDRRDGDRLHLHSLGGLHHVDYNTPGLFSYEQFLRTILTLGLDYPTLEEAYRRCVFNIMAVNQDDHVKNISFLMDSRGAWHLAPAYDLTYARGTGYTRTHQMTVNRKRDDYTRGDLIGLGEKFGIKRNGNDIIDTVADALTDWATFAGETGVPQDLIRFIGDQFRLT